MEKRSTSRYSDRCLNGGRFMRLKQILPYILLAVSANGAFAADGPFGVSMGDDPMKLGCAPLTAAGTYRCNTLPKAHSAFEGYVLKSTEQTGVCWIKAVGLDVNVNSAGSEIRMQVDQLAEQISITYGKAAPLDWLQTGSIWDEYEEWMMALSKGERIYSYEWDARGKKNLTQVYLAAVTSRADQAYAVAEFSFSNKTECDDILKRKEAGAF